jgi:exonuclease V
MCHQQQLHGLKHESNGMASPAIEPQLGTLMNDSESDYGSDFSPEEEQIVSRLLSGQQIEIEDNPIVSNVEHNEPAQTLRVPRVFGREQKFALFEAVRAAEEVAKQISKSVKTSNYYPDCKSPLVLCLIKLTDAEASSEQPDSRTCS